MKSKRAQGDVAGIRASRHKLSDVCSPSEHSAASPLALSTIAAPPAPAAPVLTKNPSLFAGTIGFIRANWLRMAAISGLTLIPCFWHREIEAADLGSHVYNAWLAQLIERRQVHGLWIDHRWNNILFDYILSGLGSFLSLHTAERIAVAIAVLIFFWGAFALIRAATQRPPWYVAPCLAMVAYGWTFEMGFFNYYLALGLSFFSLAIVWQGKGWERLVALAIAPVVVLAHPLGLFWLGAASAYILLARRWPFRYHVWLLLLGIAILAGTHLYLWHQYAVEPQRGHHVYFFNGGDQFLLFGARYRIVEGAFLVFVLISLAWDIAARPSEARFPARYAIPLQLYALVFAAAFLLPRGIHVPDHVGAVALLTERLTSVSALLLCWLLGAMRPAKWHLAASAAIALVFFGLVYRDTGAIERIEGRVAQLVRTLPPNQRVLGTILPPNDWRVTIQHVLDRACIGYCFSYGNYEPGSRMFRVRANPGNPFVLSDYLQAVATEEGYYTVEPNDLPVYQVGPCSANTQTLCIRPLHANQDNGEFDSPEEE